MTPHPQDELYLVNGTLITAIGEWDKGPHDINKILALLRACPYSPHTPAPAADDALTAAYLKGKADGVKAAREDAIENSELFKAARFWWLGNRPCN